MLSSTDLHPSGQIPAYEWNFGDVNPPVHAAALALVSGLGLQTPVGLEPLAEPEQQAGERAFLADAFNMLLVNFTWWVNRKDPSGKNLFHGGFLGLDNIGVFDRSAQLPGGITLEQSDGTAWMAFFRQSMLELALALADHDPAYEDFVVKFVQHWFQIAAAMDPLGESPDEMWDEEDGFFYDVLRMPDGTGRRIQVRSLVGLLPLCATAVLPAAVLARFPASTSSSASTSPATTTCSEAPPTSPSQGSTDAACSRSSTRTSCAGSWNRCWTRRYSSGRTASGLCPSGTRTTRTRSTSKVSPMRSTTSRPSHATACLAETPTGGFRIECPTGSGHEMNLYEVAEELGRRLATTFTRGEDGRRPVFGGTELFQEDPS
jgi:hypothetical protein